MNNSIQQQIKKRIAARGLEQQEVAAALGFHKSQLSKWLSGHHNALSDKRIDAVIEFLDGRIVPAKIVWRD